MSERGKKKKKKSAKRKEKKILPGPSEHTPDQP
jgi:hypothetical protein